MSESNSSSSSAEANVGPILLDIKVNDEKYSIRGKSDLEAVRSLLSAPDAMVIIICRRNLPPEILRYLYTDVAPQLATFGINLPGMANCSFTESDYLIGCRTEKLRCSCCSYQRYDFQDCKSGWVCEELQNVYYAETRERNAKETTTPRGDAQSSRKPQESIGLSLAVSTFLSKIYMTPGIMEWVLEKLENSCYAAARKINAKEMTNPNGNAQSFRLPQEPIEFTPSTITFRQLYTTESRRKNKRCFALTGQEFFFLSNQADKRRIVFTNKPLPSEPHYSDEYPTLSLIRLLGIRLICDEWDKILQAYKLQLNDVRKEIGIKDRPDPRSILLTLDKAAEAGSELENMHNLQLQLFESFNGLSWYKGLADKYTNISDTKKRMENFGNTIQDSISKKVDSLFQRASNIVSIEEAFKSREQGASMKRLSWITFIFLPLLFVASLYGMNIDLLAKNPSWTTCFYIGAPVFLAVMATVLILKYRKIPNKTTKILDMVAFFCSIFRSLKQNTIPDEENPTITTPSTLPEHWLLFDAAKHGNAGAMRAMIERNSPLNVSNHDGWKPLQLAASNGHDEIVDLILKSDTLKSNSGLVNAPPAQCNGRTALQAAAGSGHRNIVKRLLDAGADVNAEPSERNGRTALQAAAENGHWDIVDRLLDGGANANDDPCLVNGRTALQAAAGSGHGNIVNRLLDAQADVNAKPCFDNGRTALQAAAGSGRGGIVNCLLNAGADVNAEPSYRNGRTALQAAAGSGHRDIVNRLFDAQADVNAKPCVENGRTALQAASENGRGDIVNRLLDAGANANAEPSYRNGRTALHAAAENGHEDIVNSLLNAQADVNAKPCFDNWRTALQAAAENGHGDIVNRLLDAGADVNAPPTCNSKQPALQPAAGSNYVDIVICVLKAHADTNARSGRDHGRTALQAAAENGHGDIVNRLLDAGADVNAESSEVEGRTALQAAAGSGHGDIVNRLLDAHADVNAKPCLVNGRTALQAAAGSGHGDIVNRLLDSAADVNAPPARYGGRTTLQAAAGGGHGDIVNRLLDAGADVNSIPVFIGGLTALQAAAIGGHSDIVKRLLQAGASLSSMTYTLKSFRITALELVIYERHTEVMNALRAANDKPTNEFWQNIGHSYSEYQYQSFLLYHDCWLPLMRRMADVVKW